MNEAPRNDALSADERARSLALEPDRSFLVQAPAGSGKTTVLTQRYLRLLTTVDEPEQVLAITFTRKAAGEMRERVQRALAGEAMGKGPAAERTLELAARVREHASQRGWGLEESAARLRIQTIDSFNSYLANSLPITSRGGFAQRTTDDAEHLYQLAARATLRDAESDAAYQKDFELVMRRLDDRWADVEKLIAKMLARRAEWLPNLPDPAAGEVLQRIENSLARLVGEMLSDAAGELGRELVRQGCAVARVAAMHIDAGDAKHVDVVAWREAPEMLAPSVENLALWRGIAFLALNEEGGPRSKMSKTIGLPATVPAAKAAGQLWKDALAAIMPREIDALAVLRALPDPRMDDKQRRALAALARLLRLAAAELELQFKQRGECDHTAIAGRAREALTVDNSPTPLAERLGTRLTHILIDEFQDTSREQFDLLETLTSDWSPGDGRTLFLVGDPMQSIYGFRNAEVGRFATVREAGLRTVRLEALALTRNFRSAPALVLWGNEVFSRVFPREDDARSSAVRHLPSVAARDSHEPPPRVYRVAAHDAVAAEARAIAALVAELKRSRPGESIAILATSRRLLRPARAALTARGIASLGVKLDALAEVAAVRDLEALTRALESPLDRIAWLAVLRAPFVGLTLPDLTLLAEAAGSQPLLKVLEQPPSGLSNDAVARLARAMPVLLEGWRCREREPWASRVERVWLALGGAATCGAQEQEYARQFFAAIDELESARLRGRTVNLEELMNELYAIDTDVSGDAVSLMTIHGAKGLEFDHVIVPGIGMSGRPDESRLLNWLELPRAGEPDDLLMAPIRARNLGEGQEDDAINRFLGGLHRARARAERSRLAYVALTRAKSSLHLFVHPVPGEDEGAWTFKKNTLLENLWPALEAALPEAQVVGEEEAQSAMPALPRRRLPVERRAPELWADIESRGAVVAPAAEEEIEFSWARQSARRVGTVVHEALERFGSHGLPSVAQIELQRAWLESRLAALGLDAEAARAGAAQALSALRGTLGDERGRWLFAPSHRDAQSELALSGARGSAIVNIIIDRTFVSDDGTRWIVDFKTSPHQGGNVDAFLAAEVERYTGQLQRYAELVRDLGPEPVRAGLYFPLLGAWREVPLR
jgi:ATP-dependent helicase/nuclease subunit A